ncbi:MAG: hypothetical protein ACKOQ4_03460 [Mycobacterium sp.]
MTTLRGIVLAPMAVLAGALISVPLASADSGQAPSAPCYDGIVPLNPYANNCALPQRPPHVLGSAPDQTALINCSVGSPLLRAQCLSAYVNGGYGGYPGFVVGIG